MSIGPFSALFSASLAAVAPPDSAEVQAPLRPPESIAITQLPDGDILVSAERFVVHADGSVTAESGPEAPPPLRQWIEISAESVEVSSEGDVTFIGNLHIQSVSNPPIDHLTIDGKAASLIDVTSAHAIHRVHVDRDRHTLNVETRR